MDTTTTMAPLPLLTTTSLLLFFFLASSFAADVVVAGGGGGGGGYDGGGDGEGGGGGDGEGGGGGGGAKMPHVNHGRYKCGPWVDGHATFYGGRDASGTTEGGACGYKDADGYGAMTAAVSPALFDNGAGCGACYELKGDSGKTVVVTATNQAPPPVNGMKGEHFDLTMPAFLSIAEEKLGVVPVSYRK